VDCKSNIQHVPMGYYGGGGYQKIKPEGCHTNVRVLTPRDVEISLLHIRSDVGGFEGSEGVRASSSSVAA